MSHTKENMTPKKDKKKVNIKVVNPDEVVQHIVMMKNLNLDEKRSKRKSVANDQTQRLTYTPTFDQRKSVQEDLDDDDGDDDCDKLNPSGTGRHCDMDSEEPLVGENLFKFKTPKKSGQMALKALDTRSPSTPGRSPCGKGGKNAPAIPSPLTVRNQKSVVSPGVTRTPPRSQRSTPARKSLDAGLLTPQKSLGAAALREHKRMESSTPYRLRKREVNETQDSSSDDSVDASSEEDEDGDNDSQGNGGDVPANSNKNNDIDVTASAEAYFDLHAMTPITSDRTLASLEGPRLDVDTVRTTLAKLTPTHSKQCAALMTKYAGMFDRWMLNMCQGFNILLHGLGSKRSLLETFTEKQLSKFSHVVVNGYFPSLTVKHILNSITEDILDCSKGFTNNQAQLDYIKQEFTTKDIDFYLVINNIDGVLLRSEKCQSTLSLLAEIEGVHIIASLDHINAGFMWDQNKFFRFHWLWYETPTFAPYEAENCYENSLLVQQTGGLAMSSLSHVMRSLTPNAQQIFLVLAEYQMENGDTPNYAGMSFQVLYHRCREAFLVNSDLTLQAQLVEFKDHRLLKAKKNFEGIEHLSIPINHLTLKEFLQEYKNK